MKSTEVAEEAVAEAPALLPEATPEELKSETGADFKPLADALRNRDFFEADQITRDMLIQIAGKGVGYLRPSRPLPERPLTQVPPYVYRLRHGSSSTGQR